MTYHAGLSKGSGTAWNISLSGWRLSGDLPLRVGQTCSLCVTLSNPTRVLVSATSSAGEVHQTDTINTYDAPNTLSAQMGKPIHTSVRSQSMIPPEDPVVHTTDFVYDYMSDFYLPETHSTLALKEKKVAQRPAVRAQRPPCEPLTGITATPG